jgi:hypothetical protein
MPPLFQSAVATPPPTEDSTFRRVLDYLRRPSGAIAGGVGNYLAGEDPAQRILANLTGERADDFDDVLAEQGVEDTWARRAAGFAGDVVLDPLNLVPVGAASKGIGAALRAGGRTAATGLRAAGFDDLVRSATGVKDAFGKAFVPYYSLKGTPDYAKARRLFDSERRSLPNRVFAEYGERFAALPDAEVRNAVNLALDAGSAGTDLPAAAQAAIAAQRVRNTAMGREGVALGILDESAVAAREGTYTGYVMPKPGMLGRPAKGRMINPTSGFAKERTSASLAEAIADHGAEADAAVSSFLRTLDHERAAQSARLLEQVAANPSLASEVAGPGLRQLAETAPLTAAQAAKYGHLWVPDAVADDLARVFARGEETEPILAGFDRLMQMWRKGATVLRPGFHATNLTGNVYNAALGGLKNPLRYAQGWAKEASDDVAQSIGHGHTADAINDALRKHGMTPVGGGDTFGAGELGKIHSTGGLAEQLRTTLNGRTEPKTLRDILATPWRKYSGMMSRLGDRIEGGSKRALFYDELAKGASIDDAVLGVKDKLFDYAELTEFEKKYMRTLFPFWTWTRKNVPLQVTSLIDNPAMPARVAKLSNALEDLGEDRGLTTPTGHRPSWYQKQGFLPLPLALAGGAQTYLNPRLPLLDLNKIPGFGEMSSFEDSAGEMVSSLSPLIKAPIELGVNHSFFKKRPSYDSALGLGADTSPAPAFFQIPGIREIAQAVPGVRVDQQGQTVLPTATNYTFEQSLPFVASLGRAGQSAVDPDNSSNASGLWKFLGAPLETRSAEQQRKDRQASIRRAANTRKAQRAEDAMPETTVDDTRARIARMLARVAALEEP